LAEYSIKYIFAKFHQNFDTKKWNIYIMESFNLCQKNIFSNEHLLILFYYLMSITFLSKHFVSWYVHTDLPTCQNVDMEIIWGHEMMGRMLLLMSLTCAQEDTQYKCKWTKTCEILILFNGKPIATQISKIITNEIMIP
jgi:hypothetical protein